MFRDFLRRADRLLIVAHGVVWTIVMIVWSFAWRVEPAPMGPLFNFAKRFLGRIDGITSGSIEEVSVNLAIAVHSHLGADLGLLYALIFACLILVGGTIQWFLIGRLLQSIASKYGQPGAAILTGFLAICVTLVGVSWVMSW